MAARLTRHVVFAAVSIAFASRFFSFRHPGSHAITDGDPALMCWTLQWMSHALVHDPLHWYAGNTFYPYPHAILLSDPMVSLAVVNAAVRAFTANPWVGYNLLLLLAFYLSAVWGARLAEEVTGSTLAGWWGGVFWGFLFFRVHHIGHLQILSFQAIPLAVVCLLRFWQSPNARSAALFALTFVAQSLVSWYLATILTATLIVVALSRPVADVFSRRALRYSAMMLGLAVAAVAPFAWPYARAFGDSTLADRLSLIDRFGDAVRLRDYVTPPDATLAGSLFAHNEYSIWGENTLYIGGVAIALAVIGLIVERRRRRWLIAGAALVVVGYVLALGFVSPSLGIALPLHYAAVAFPFLGGLRATPRFSLILYLGVLVLSALGLDAMLSRLESGRLRAFVTFAVGAGFLIDVFPWRLPISPRHTYAVSGPDRAIARVQAGRAQPLVVLHLPIYYATDIYPASEATYMVDSTLHWAKILNGFSGGVPVGFMDRMATLARVPDPDAIAAVRGLGVDVIAVHDAVPPERRRAIAAYFLGQRWATVMPLADNEALVLIDHSGAQP